MQARVPGSKPSKKNMLTTSCVRAIISHKYSKPVIERSISTQRMRKESRRRWEGGRTETEEWAHEGGKKALLRVMADGIFTRYKGSIYVGIWNEWAIFSPKRVVPQKSALLSLCRG
jgi:peptidyl-tRNA hydrolase